MAVQNPYLTTDGDINRAKRKRAGEAMAIAATPAGALDRRMSRRSSMTTNMAAT